MIVTLTRLPLSVRFLPVGLFIGRRPPLLGFDKPLLSAARSRRARMRNDARLSTTPSSQSDASLSRPLPPLTLGFFSTLPLSPQEPNLFTLFVVNSTLALRDCCTRNLFAKSNLLPVFSFSSLPCQDFPLLDRSQVAPRSLLSDKRPRSALFSP